MSWYPWTTTLGVWLFSVGMASFLKNGKQLMNALISLELISLSLALIFLSTSYLSGEAWFIVFLTIIVCEGALGLSVLVYVIRAKGSDFMNNQTSMSW